MVVAHGQGFDFMLPASQQSAPTSVYAGLNAADPVNEVNGTSNMGGLQNMLVSVTSNETTDGDYALRGVLPGSGGFNLRLATQNLGPGDVVDISFDLYVAVITGNNYNVFPMVRDTEGWSFSANRLYNTGTYLGVWANVLIDGVEPDIPNPEIVVLTGTGNAGDTFYIDNVVITKQ